MRSDINADRIVGAPLQLDYSQTSSFFATRGKGVSSNPLVATMYQDPDLAAQRDLAEKSTVFPLLKVCSEDRVLDLGCGSGRWAQVIAPSVSQYLGIDFSEPLLEAARVRVPLAEFQAMNVAAFDPRKLAVRPPFTLVICSGILAYINDPDVKALFSEISRITAERSRLYIREPIAKDCRLTLNRYWSEELQAHYSAIYRMREEYLDLFGELNGFGLHDEGAPFPPHLQNRTETEQRYFLLER
jgi:ubiquinone/menaquinone biosynthesis C-methylase UbiE